MYIYGYTDHNRKAENPMQWCHKHWVSSLPCCSVPSPCTFVCNMYTQMPIRGLILKNTSEVANMIATAALSKPATTSTLQKQQQ